MRKFISYLTIFLMSGLLSGLCFADSDLKWSHPESQNGTYVLGAVLITNSTATNLTVDTLTVKAGGLGITAGDITTTAGTVKTDRVTANLAEYSGMAIADVPKNSFTFMEDFFTIIATATNAETMSRLLPWKYTGDGGDETDITLATETGGVLVVTTGSTDNNEAYLQYGALGTEAFVSITSNSGKKVWAEFRVKGSHASGEGGTFYGLASAGSSAANFLVDDTGELADKDLYGFIHNTLDTNTLWQFVYRKNGQTAVTNRNIAANAGGASFIRLGLYFDGVNKIYHFVNGTANARIYTNNAATFPNAVNLSPIIASKTSDASTSRTNKVDYIFIQQQR